MGRDFRSGDRDVKTLHRSVWWAENDDAPAAAGAEGASREGRDELYCRPFSMPPTISGQSRFQSNEPSPEPP